MCGVVFGKGHARYDAYVHASHCAAVQPYSIAVYRRSMGWFVVDDCVLRCPGSCCIVDLLTVDVLFGRYFTGFNTSNMQCTNCMISSEIFLNIADVLLRTE